MPITLLDLVLLAVMLISGLLAMVRGFMREILSIAAWGAAALATLYSFSKLLPTAKTYFNNDTVASIVVVAGVFRRDPDRGFRYHGADFRHDLDSGSARWTARSVPVWTGARPADRVVAFLFFSWLVPDKQRPDW